MIGLVLGLKGGILGSALAHGFACGLSFNADGLGYHQGRGCAKFKDLGGRLTRKVAFRGDVVSVVLRLILVSSMAANYISL